MIYGEHIRFRSDERSDIPQFVQWLNDPEVLRFLSVNDSVSMASEEQWFESMLKRPFIEQPYAIEVRCSNGEGSPETWKLIGNCGFMDVNWKARSAEVGLFIGDKSCWNKGYGTEVMRLLLRIGFETWNLNRIFLRVDEANKGGIRAYEKAGFVHEGRQRQANFYDGMYGDILFMSVLRSEWKREEQN